MTRGFEHDAGEDKRRPDHDVGKDKGSNPGKYRRIQEIRDPIRASVGEGWNPGEYPRRVRASTRKG